MTAQLQYLVTRSGQRVKLPWDQLTDAEQCTFQFVHLTSERTTRATLERIPRMIPVAQRQTAAREYDLGQHLLTIDPYSLTITEKQDDPDAVSQEIRLDEQGLYCLHTILLLLFAR